MQKMSLIVILFSRVGKINKDMLWGWGEVLRIVMSFVIIAYVPRLKQFEIHMINRNLDFITQDQTGICAYKTISEIIWSTSVQLLLVSKTIRLEDNSFLLRITIYVTFNIDQCIFITMPNVKKRSILFVNETREN